MDRSSAWRDQKARDFCAGINAPIAQRTGSWLPLLVGLLIASGCSTAGYYHVKGKVVDSQGQPIAELAGSQIIFSLINGTTSSEGEIQADGSFQLFTLKPGDGAPPGDYQVYIPRRYLDPEHAGPQVIDAKYEKPDTSGLHATVEKKTNTFEFKVERPTAKRR